MYNLDEPWVVDLKKEGLFLTDKLEPCIKMYQDNIPIPAEGLGFTDELNKTKDKISKVESIWNKVKFLLNHSELIDIWRETSFAHKRYN